MKISKTMKSFFVCLFIACFATPLSAMLGDNYPSTPDEKKPMFDIVSIENQLKKQEKKILNLYPGAKNFIEQTKKKIIVALKNKNKKKVAALLQSLEDFSFLL